MGGGDVASSSLSARARRLGREASFFYGAKLEVFAGPDARRASAGRAVTARARASSGAFGGLALAGAAAGLVPDDSINAAGIANRKEEPFVFFGCKFDQTTVPASAGSVTASSASCRSPPHAAASRRGGARAGVAGNFTVFGATFEFQAHPIADTLRSPRGRRGRRDTRLRGGRQLRGLRVRIVGVRRWRAVGRRDVRARASARPPPQPPPACAESAAVRARAAVRRETANNGERATAGASRGRLANGARAPSATSQTAFVPLSSPLVLSLEPRATAAGGTGVRVFGRGICGGAPAWPARDHGSASPRTAPARAPVRCKSPEGARPPGYVTRVLGGRGVTTDAVLSFSVMMP